MEGAKCSTTGRSNRAPPGHTIQPEDCWKQSTSSINRASSGRERHGRPSGRSTRVCTSASIGNGSFEQEKPADYWRPKRCCQGTEFIRPTSPAPEEKNGGSSSWRSCAAILRLSVDPPLRVPGAERLRSGWLNNRRSVCYLASEGLFPAPMPIRPRRSSALLSGFCLPGIQRKTLWQISGIR